MSDDGEKRRRIIGHVVSVIFVLLSHVVGFTPQLTPCAVGMCVSEVGRSAPTT